MDLQAVADFDRAFHPKRPPFVQELFDKQLVVFNDPSKRRSIRTTRRAGKTHFNVIDHLNDMETYPGEQSYYITPRLYISQRNIERPLREMIRKYSLPIKRTVVSGQIIYVHQKTEHTLWITGCKDLTEADKLRGDKVRKVKLDEGGAWRSDVLSYLIRESVGPALSDNDGVLDITGTPSPLPTGFWHAVDTGMGKGDFERLKQWSAHSWSVLDNPHHRFYQRPDLIQKELDESYGGDPTNPAFLREWQGMWAADLNSLIYHYDPSRNSCYQSEMPSGGGWYFVLSIDLGWKDYTTFTISASQFGNRSVYFLESYGAGEMRLPQIVAQIERIRLQYPLGKIVIDTGGLGTTIAETFKGQGIPCVAADKKPGYKGVRIRELAAGLIGGWVKVDPYKCSQLIGEWETLAWDDKRLDHSPLCSDDCSDGALYGFAEHPTYETWEEVPPEPGSPEATDLEARQSKLREAQRLAIEHSGMSRGAKRRALRRAG